MAIVEFYEKPGCIGNAKQKKLLLEAGHDLNVHNLLTEAWTQERLRSFFGDRPVVEWFNPTAPPITSGKLCPEQIGTDMALKLMVEQPILIRRPLMQVGDRRTAGFDCAEVDAWVGLAPQSDLTQDVQTCPHTVAN